MSEVVRMCSCGGRALLADEALCPSCQRSRNSIASQLAGAKSKLEVAGRASGQAGAALFGKLVNQAKTSAQVVEHKAGSLVQSGVAVAKTRTTEALKVAASHAEAGGQKALQATIPYAERLLGRAKTYLDKKPR